MHATKTPWALTPMYKAQGSEEVLGVLMLKTPSNPCALYIWANVRGGFEHARAQKPPPTFAHVYMVHGSEVVLSIHGPKTASDPSALNIGAKVRGGFAGVHAQNPLGPFRLIHRVNVRGGFEHARHQAEPPRTLATMYKAQVSEGFWGRVYRKPPRTLVLYT